MGFPWDFHPLVGEPIRLDLVREDDLAALHEMQSAPATWGRTTPIPLQRVCPG